jgi:hypothetical protein
MRGNQNVNTISQQTLSKQEGAKDFGLTQRRKDAKGFFILMIILCDVASLRE